MNNDYDRVCKELLDRIDKAFSQGHQLVSMILVYWAAIFAGLMGAFGKDIWLKLYYMPVFPLVVAALSLLPLVPILLILPYTVKFYDHMRCLTSCVAYIRVFYELPHMLHKKDAAIAASWETVHVNFKFPFVKKIASEYRTISGFSLILSIVTFSASNVVVFKSSNNYIIPCICLVLMLAFYIWFYFQYMRPIYIYTDTAIFFGTYAEMFLNEYLQRAKYLNLLVDEDIKAYKKYCEDFKRFDQKLEDKIKKPKIGKRNQQKSSKL